MNKEVLYRLLRIDSLIKIKGTGTPDELARRIGVSKRTIYDYLNIMREFGAPIKYSAKRKSYYYDGDGSFNISFLSEHNQEENGDDG